MSSSSASSFTPPNKPADHSDDWDAEVARRRAEVISGKVKLIPAEEVHRSIERLTG